MKASRQDQALSNLRALIISGGLQPGERLIELDLCSRLHVSRTPVRHAIAVLAQERLVEDTSVGFVVRSIPREEVAEAAELHGVIESLAVKTLASRGLSRAVRKELHQLLDEGAAILAKGFVVEQDLQPFSRMNGRFHELIKDAGASPLVADLMNRLKNLTVHTPGDMPFALDSLAGVHRLWTYGQFQHEALVAAMESGNVDRAVSLSREHALIQRDALESQWLDIPSPGS